MFNLLFTKKPSVDENTRQWIFDTFAWAVEHFNIQVFQEETQLVLPTNEFYSGRVGSVTEMAQNIFEHTVEYASMQNWPLKLVEPQLLKSIEFPSLIIQNALRGKDSRVDFSESNQQGIQFTFNPNQINQPQDLIASYVQQLATILVMQQKILPPGGKDFLPQAIDVLSCVMGFGVIFANTAYQFKGGCGSCFNPKANRQASLSENDTVYVLALFCLLKSQNPKSVKRHLKGHLRKTFGHAYSELSLMSKKSEIPLSLMITT
jgi:hypothetical protein